MPSVRTAVTTSLALVAGSLARTVTWTRSAVERLWTLLRAAAARSVVWTQRVAAGPARTAPLGRRAGVSLAVALAAPVLAAVAAWWVLAAVGGPGTLGNWITGTWSGTDPAVAVALVVAAGAASARLVPTTVLVAGPVFGALVTRYGTEAPRLVSLPDAVVFAAAGAAVGGGLLGAVSFCLGVAVRRVVWVLTGGPGAAGRQAQP
jgi:hypothetical protein